MNNHLKTAVLIVTFLSSGLANARDDHRMYSLNDALGSSAAKEKRVSGFSGGRTGLIEVPRSAWARWTIDCALRKYAFNSGLKVCTSTGSSRPKTA